MRRAPRWVYETTAWTAAAILVAAIAVLTTGVIGSRTTTHVSQAYGETPVVRVDPSAAPAPIRPAAPVRHRPQGVPLESSLGPPPGPFPDPRPARTAPPEARWALLVGVTRYNAPTHPTIAGANDAAYVRSALLAAGWLPDHVRVLTEGAATGAAVRSGLAWLTTKSVPGSFTLFHFSGHVKQEGGHEKLWPVDRDFVPDTEVAGLLAQGRGKLWMDIAGCESGGFMEGLPSSRVLVSTSSLSSQKSYEYPPWGESVWTGLVFDLGLVQGQADADGNGRTTVGEALRYAAYWAQAITLHQQPYGRQTPQVAGDPVRGWTLADPPA